MTRTYGTLRFKGPTKDRPGGSWIFKADPHVMQRAKRLWKKGRSVKSITLDATGDAAVDLLWFMGRYPLEVSDLDRIRLEGVAQGHEERIRRVQDYLGAHIPPPEYAMATSPRDYQARSAAVVHEQGYLLVTDQLGLGKTCTAITVLSDPKCLPAVVVVPTHLPKQWKAEIAKFLPGLRTHIVPVGAVSPLPGAVDSAGQGQLPGQSPDVVILPYSRLAKWAQILSEYATTVVFDEAQELRRSESLKYSGAKALAGGPNVRYRCLLTATPVYNYGDEIFNVTRIMAPGCLGTRYEFLEEWCVPVGNGKHRVTDPRALGSFLREQGLMVRHTREEVGRELPETIPVVREIGAEAKRLDEVKGRAAELARILLGDGEHARGEALMAGGELDRIVRQATGLAKAPFVADFVQLLVESDERVVLGLWHHAVYDAIEERLQHAGIECARYTGHENPAKKEANAQRFMRGEVPVLMLSLRSGVGLNGLQEASRVAVFGELDWSPQVMEQFIGRLRRDGQSSPVLAYYLVADSGADPVMAQTLGLKREQSEGILTPNAETTKLFATGGEDRARRLAEEWLRRNAA